MSARSTAYLIDGEAEVSWLFICPAVRAVSGNNATSPWSLVWLAIPRGRALGPVVRDFSSLWPHAKTTLPHCRKLAGVFESHWLRRAVLRTIKGSWCRADFKDQMWEMLIQLIKDFVTEEKRKKCKNYKQFNLATIFINRNSPAPQVGRSEWSGPRLNEAKTIVFTSRIKTSNILWSDMKS